MLQIPQREALTILGLFNAPKQFLLLFIPPSTVPLQDNHLCEIIHPRSSSIDPKTLPFLLSQSQCPEPKSKFSLSSPPSTFFTGATPIPSPALPTNPTALIVYTSSAAFTVFSFCAEPSPWARKFLRILGTCI